MSAAADLDLHALRMGGKPALARALSRAETRLDDPEVARALDLAVAGGRALTLGITGPPGVGKSSLASALIRRFRGDGLSVGVIAVDPSSRRSGGALLGDRARFDVDPEDEGVFVRSMAARARLGGLADETYAALALMRAVADRLIVETVGVGQSETDVTQVADLVLLCIQPGAGDSLQYMKAGIAEVPDLAVVTKADLGPMARQAKAEVETAWTFGAGGSPPAVILVSASSGEGVDQLARALEQEWRQRRASGALARRRSDQHAAWAEDLIRSRHGRHGLATVAGDRGGSEGEGPFARVARVTRMLDARLSRA